MEAQASACWYRLRWRVVGLDVSSLKSVLLIEKDYSQPQASSAGSSCILREERERSHEEDLTEDSKVSSALPKYLEP